MDLSAFAGFIGSISTTAELAKTGFAVRDAAKLEQVKAEFSERISRLAFEAAQLPTEHVALLQEKLDLERQVHQLQNQLDDFDRYELRELPTGALVYALKPTHQGEQPAHHICPRCRDVDHKKSILQPSQVGDTRGIRCTVCNAGFATEPPAPRPPRPRRTSRSIDF